MFSRLDRVNATLHPVALRNATISVGLLRDVSSRLGPSDHRVVRAVSGPKPARAAGSVTVFDCTSAGLAGRMRAELDGYPHPRDLTTRMSILRKAAGRAKRCAQADALATSPPAHFAHVAHCSRILRIRPCKLAAKELPETCAGERRATRPTPTGRWRRGCQGFKLRSHIDPQALQEIAAIEASSMPETHKSAKKQIAKRRQAMFRLTRRRSSLDANSLGDWRHDR